MNQIRFTSSDHAKWVYCVDRPEKGDRVHVTNSELAEPVHLKPTPQQGKWIYVERVKTIYIGEKWIKICADDYDEIKYHLLKIDEDDNWLLEIRKRLFACYGEGEIPYGDCKILGPHKLQECFKLIFDENMVNELINVEDTEVCNLARAHFGCEPRKEKSWFTRLFQ